MLPAIPAAAATFPGPGSFKAYASYNYIKLTWNNPSESFSYTVIERRTDQDSFYPLVTLNQSITSYNDYDILNGHIYTYRARTYYYNGNYSSYTQEVKIVYLYSTNLQITGAFSDHIDLEWSVPALPAAEIPDYKTIVERCKLYSTTWEQIASLPVSETYYRDTNVDPDTTYYYRIRTQFGTDNYSPYYPYSGGLSTRTLVPLTTNLWAHAIATDKIKLEWDASYIGDGNVVVEKYDSYSGFVTIYTGTDDYYIDRNVTQGRTYTYRLCLISRNGYRSEYTEEVSLNAEPLPTVTGFEAKAISFDCVALSWVYPYDDETGFEIWRKSDFTWKLIAKVPRNTLDFYDYSAETGKTYEYRIRALRGTTAFSSFAHADNVINRYPGSPGEPVFILNQGYVTIYSKNKVPIDQVYTLEYRKNLNSPWEVMKSANTGTLTVWLPFSSQTEYYFRIRANLGNLETVGPEIHFCGSPPDTPKNLQVQHLGYNRVTLIWEDMTDKEEGYYIYRSVRKADGSLERTLAGSVGKDMESFTDSSPPAGSNVYYEAVAFNFSGESKAVGISVRIPSKTNYRDLAQYQWAHDSIYTLQGLGAFVDASNGLFNPQNAVSRGQLARMVIKSFNISYLDPDLLPPADITPQHIYYSDMITAVRLGFIHPDENGNVYPNKSVTRREVLLMLNSALGYKGLSLNQYETDILEQFNDYNLVAAEDANIIASFVGDSIISGKSGQQLSLHTYATKVEAVAFVYRTLVKYRLI